MSEFIVLFLLFFMQNIDYSYGLFIERKNLTTTDRNNITSTLEVENCVAISN